MAVWQYEMLLLPKEAVTKHFAGIPPCLDCRDLEGSEWWSDKSSPSDYVETLGRFLRLSESWSRDVQVWGEQDGNRFQVVKQHGKVVEMAAFIDIRRLDMRFVESVVAFAVHCNCLILLEDMTLLEPNACELLSRIKGSKSAHFVNNPEGFLERLKQRSNRR